MDRHEPMPAPVRNYPRCPEKQGHENAATATLCVVSTLLSVLAASSLSCGGKDLTSGGEPATSITMPPPFRPCDEKVHNKIWYVYCRQLCLDVGTMGCSQVYCNLIYALLLTRQPSAQRGALPNIPTFQISCLYTADKSHRVCYHVIQVYTLNPKNSDPKPYLRHIAPVAKAGAACMVGRPPNPPLSGFRQLCRRLRLVLQRLSGLVMVTLLIRSVFQYVFVAAGYLLMTCPACEGLSSDAATTRRMANLPVLVSNWHDASG